MNWYVVLIVIHLFFNASQAAVYMIYFKCKPEPYEAFSAFTMAELDVKYLAGPTKLSRSHDLTTESWIVLVETDDPTLLMQHVYGWIEIYEVTIIPLVDDKDAQEVFSRQLKRESLGGY